MEDGIISSGDLENKLYFYKAKIVSVYDGDSVAALIDLGLHTFSEAKIRLTNIDAPEIRGLTKEAGRKSRDKLRELILDKDVFVKTKRDKKGKYGRLLGEIWFTQDGSSFESVNNLMVKYGFAKSY